MEQNWQLRQNDLTNALGTVRLIGCPLQGGSL
jgi:hypothetical protein